MNMNFCSSILCLSDLVLRCIGSPLARAVAMSIRIGKTEALVIYQCHLWLFQKEESKIRAKLFDCAGTKSDVKGQLTATLQKVLDDHAAAGKALEGVSRDEETQRKSLDAISHTILQLESTLGIVPYKRTLKKALRSTLNAPLEASANTTVMTVAAAPAVAVVTVPVSGDSSSVAGATIDRAAASERLSVEQSNRSKLWDTLAAIIEKRNALNSRMMSLERQNGLLTGILSGSLTKLSGSAVVSNPDGTDSEPIDPSVVAAFEKLKGARYVDVPIEIFLHRVG